MNRQQYRQSQKAIKKAHRPLHSHTESAVSIADIMSDKHALQLGDFFFKKEQVIELIKAGYISNSGEALVSDTYDMLYHIIKVFPDLKLQVFPDEEDRMSESSSNYFEDQRFPIANNENNINDNDEAEDAIVKARIIIESGVEAKRKGDYAKALKRYEEAIAIAPGYLPCYYALGKLHYLLNNKEESILSYTVAAHIHASLGAAQDLNDELKEIKDERLSSFSHSLINQFRSVHHQAVMLLIDDNTPKHIGHTLVDIPANDDVSIAVRKARKSYRDAIAGKAFKQLDHELEHSMYHSTGASYLLQRIQWSKVGKHPVEDVRRLYSEEKSPSMSEAICETQLQWAFNELEEFISLRKIHSKTPFHHLVDEMALVWKAEDTTLNIEWQNLARQAFQAAEKLIANPNDISTGPLIMDALAKGNISQVTMIKRWDSSIKLVQTPLVDFLFSLSNSARSHRHQTPLLNAMIYILKNRDLVGLRNGLVHETYCWEHSKDNTFLNIFDGTTVILHLHADQCEAFHTLICACALALEAVSKSPEFNTT